METKSTEDLEGGVAELEAAFQAALLDTTTTDQFLDLLDEAMTTLYTHARRRVWIGLEWMHQSLDQDSDKFVKNFRRLIPDPMEFFTEFDDHPAIISVTCSALLNLIPEKDRLELVRPLLLREGPHSKNWVKVLQQYGIPDDDIAELVFDLLEDEEASPKARDETVKYLVANRQTDLVDKQPEFLLLGAEDYQVVAEFCAKHSPKRVLETLQLKFWDGRDETRGFTWQINHLIGTAGLEEVVAVALEARNRSKVNYVAQLRKRTLFSGGIENLVDYVLEKGNKTLFHLHLKACLAESGDDLIIIYQTKLYKLFHEHASELGWYVDSCIQKELARLGWYVAHVDITMHKHRPSRHLRHGGLCYIQPYGNRFFPRQGEEVLFNPTSGKPVGPGVYAVSFLKLER